MSVYGVWVQPIQNDTSPANLQKYGEIMDVEAAYEEDDATASAQFCDGQTSITPPRYANDGMAMIYTYSEDAARTFSGYLREDVARRITAGQLAFAQPPAWIGSAAPAFAVAGAAGMVDSVALIRKELAISESVTNTQIENQIIGYMGQSGKMTASISDIAEYIAENARWS